MLTIVVRGLERETMGRMKCQPCQRDSPGQQLSRLDLVDLAEKSAYLVSTPPGKVQRAHLYPDTCQKKEETRLRKQQLLTKFWPGHSAEEM